MTDLQKRMIETLQLGGLSERTQEAYVRAVVNWPRVYHKSPDLVAEEELRHYFSASRMSRSTRGQQQPSPCAGSSSSSNERWASNGHRSI